VSHILLDVSDSGVATITINRPEKRNVITHAMWHQLQSFCSEIASDRRVRAVILTGAGDHFCAGGDITEFETVRKDAESAAQFDADIEAAEEALANLPKPTIAAIAGYCIGGGTSLALCCDIRIGHSSCRFSIPAARLSVLYGLRDTQALVHAVGFSNAKRIMFTADQIDAREAYDSGLLQKLLDGDVKADAAAMAERIAANAPLSLAGSKLILNAIADNDAAPRAGEFRELQRRTHTSADHMEAARAFREKRKPVFTGK
jgi:enoyl-CoA hydratase/carnithine racemase